MKRLCALGLGLLVMAGMVEAVNWATGSPPINYTYFGFTGSPTNTFTTAQSSDGINWTNSGGSWATGINAPQVFVAGGAVYLHCATATDGNLVHTTWFIGKADSGGTITTITTIDWGPLIAGITELFSGKPYQEGGATYLTIPASNGNAAFAPYLTHATTGGGALCTSGCTYTTWSNPVAISVDTSNIYDPAITKIGSTYYMWFTFDTTYHWPGFAKSSSLGGPYTTVHIFKEWGPYHEGPTMYPINNRTGWRLATENIGSCYVNSWCIPDQMQYSDCNDTSIETCTTNNTWTPLKPWVEDQLYRHGSVLFNLQAVPGTVTRGKIVQRGKAVAR